MHAAARNGLDATLTWPGYDEVAVTDLVLRRLLPIAAAGLDQWGVSPDERDRMFGDHRGSLRGQRRNGATWQIATVDRLSASGMDRREALRQMTLRYIDHMHSNEPVHTWSVED